MLTAGDLIFWGDLNRRFRAFDIDSGKVLWESILGGTVTASTITYTLQWSGLTTLPLFSHIHFGPTKVNGGVMVYLCGGGGKPACTQATSGTASGTITAADIVGPAAQGIPAAPNGDFADVIRAIRTRNAYANLHTTMFPGGEVRGTVEAPRGHGE